MFLLLAGFFIASYGQIACKQKERDGEKSAGFFPVLSYLKSQVAHIDTALYFIMKITITDSLSDTTYIKREEFRGLANDFLNIPDLTEKKYKKMYAESKFYDESVNRVVITYAAKEDDLELRKEEVHIITDPAGGDKVSTIILDKFISTRDSNVQKRLLWQVNERFQVVTSIEKLNQPDFTQTLKVIWNQPY